LRIRRKVMSQQSKHIDMFPAKSYRSSSLLVFAGACLLFLLATLILTNMSYCQLLDSRARLWDAKVFDLGTQGRYEEAIAIAKELLAEREKILGKNHLDVAWSLNDLGALYRITGRYDEAELLLKRSLEIREKRLSKNHPDVGTSLANLGWLYLTTGRYGEAEALSKRSLEICEKTMVADTAFTHAETLFRRSVEMFGPRLNTDYANLENSRRLLGALYQTTGRYSEAEALLKRSLEFWEKRLGPWHQTVGANLDELGTLYRITGRYSESEPLLKRSLEIREKKFSKDHPTAAGSLSSLGELYRTTGRYDEAETLLKRSLETREKKLGKDHPTVATSLADLGLLYSTTGRYGEAEALFKRSLEISEKKLGKDHPNVATILRRLGHLDWLTGRFGEAEPLFKHSLEIREKMLGKDHPYVAISLSDLGLLFWTTGRYDEAELPFKRSIEIREKKLGKNHPDVAASLNNLALLSLDSEKWEEAYEIFSQQNNESGLGKCYLAKKDYQEAARHFSLALEKINKRAPRSVIGLQIGLGLAYEGMEEYSKSGEHFRGAIEVIEAEWKTLDPEAKREFLNAKVELGFSRLEGYEGLARVLLKLGDRESMGEALRVSERVKSRVLLEMLATREVRGKSVEDEAVLQQDREHQRGLMEVRKQIEVLEEMGQGVPPGEVDRLRSGLEEKEKSYGKFIEEVKLKNAELSSLISVDPPSCSQIQSLLDPDVELLEYYTTNEKIYAWLVSREDIRAYEIGVTQKELREKVDRLLVPNISNRPRKAEPVILYVGGEEKETGEREREENRKRFQAVLKELYETVLAPVSNDIKATNLIVVPHGVLHKVPFGALTDGSEYLIDRYTISVLPSASVLEYVVKKRKDAKEKALVLANPKTDHIPLGFAEVEGRMLESLFATGEAYYRERATETTAKQRASEFNVIHFATHGEFNERQPMQSGLLLTRDDANDGYLQVHEIFGMNLKNASLVTLSACETALSKIEGGDDLVGLSRGFIYAGTPSILATLWKVDDASTSKLMEIFYRNWKSGMSKAGALREAQETVRGMKEYEHPYYWAPFIMIGDWK
jgi:CHAT domain-containing protein/tetratricopeptide (TPR) repeat protein